MWAKKTPKRSARWFLFVLQQFFLKENLNSQSNFNLKFKLETLYSVVGAGWGGEEE